MIEFGFKRRKPRQFSYRPLYYDPEKEERDARRAEGCQIKGDKKYVPGSFIRNSRRRRMLDIDPTPAEKQAKQRRILIRMVIFLILLFIVAVLIMRSTFFETLITTFGRK